MLARTESQSGGCDVGAMMTALVLRRSAVCRQTHKKAWNSFVWVWEWRMGVSNLSQTLHRARPLPTICDVDSHGVSTKTTSHVSQYCPTELHKPSQNESQKVEELVKCQAAWHSGDPLVAIT